MDDEVVIGDVELQPVSRQLVPMQVGSATVWVEQIGSATEIEVDDEVYAASPDTEEAFAKAVEVLRECVKSIGSELKQLEATLRPPEVTVEFSISLEAKGKAHIIPVLLTGETGVTTGLKVAATWRREGTAGG